MLYPDIQHFYSCPIVPEASFVVLSAWQQNTFFYHNWFLLLVVFRLIYKLNSRFPDCCAESHRSTKLFWNKEWWRWGRGVLLSWWWAMNYISQTSGRRMLHVKILEHARWMLELLGDAIQEPGCRGKKAFFFFYSYTFHSMRSVSGKPFEKRSLRFIICDLFFCFFQTVCAFSKWYLIHQML